LREASVAVRAVERDLFSPLSQEQQRRLRDDLAACVASAARSATATAQERPVYRKSN
jgi:hypothetical protein